MSWTDFYAKMSNADSDLRFMAVSDLIGLLNNSSLSIGGKNEEAKLLEAVVKLLLDQNAEVVTLYVSFSSSIIPFAISFSGCH